MVIVIRSRGVGTCTDAEIWLLTESIIELLAYNVRAPSLCSHLSVDKSEKVNDLLVGP